MRLLLVSLALVCSSAIAEGPCDGLPEYVQRFLRSEPGWRILEMKDLVEDDRVLWEKFHKGLCPGFAVIDLDGAAEKSYALALVQFAKGRASERLVVVTKENDQPRARVLVPPVNIIYTDVAAPFVVWRTPPGTYRDLKTGRQVKISRDGIVYERMEANARLFFLENKRIKSIVTSE